jgi:hypothetical protein
MSQLPGNRGLNEDVIGSPRSTLRRWVRKALMVFMILASLFFICTWISSYCGWLVFTRVRPNVMQQVVVCFGKTRFMYYEGGDYLLAGSPGYSWTYPPFDFNSYEKTHQSNVINMRNEPCWTFQWDQFGKEKILTIRVPIWLFVLLPALFLAGLSHRDIRRQYRRNRGYCIECGYDLRGSPNRPCPECGSEADSKSNPCTKRD